MSQDPAPVWPSAGLRARSFYQSAGARPGETPSAPELVGAMVLELAAQTHELCALQLAALDARAQLAGALTWTRHGRVVDVDVRGGRL